MKLSDWLVRLETCHPKAVDLGLERVGEVAVRLKLTHFSCPVVTVGGTNGKGSSVAFLDAILRAQGYRVGTYTSPHLWRYNERVCIDGKPVSDEMLCAAFAAIEQVRAEISLTYFEWGTLAALFIFQAAKLEAIVLEVGLGGRLDAVNVVDSDVALVSTVALDHEQWLGKDRESIGVEKAGIFRRGKPAICGDVSPPVRLCHYAKQIGAKLYLQGKAFAYSVTENDWQCWGESFSMQHLPLPTLPVQNAASVLQVLYCLQSRLPVSRRAIEQGLASASLPGRMQIVRKPVMQIFDVAHNPEATTYLAKKLQMTPTAGKTYAVVGMLADKDITASLAPLVSVIDQWYLATLNVGRGARAEQLAAVLEQFNCHHYRIFLDVTSAHQAALDDANLNTRIIIFGSFYTVAEALRD